MVGGMGHINTALKTNEIFAVQKLGVYFSRNNLSSNKLMGYVDLSHFYEIVSSLWSYVLTQNSTWIASCIVLIL